MAEVEGLAGVDASHFELLTGAAFRWFADLAVDVAVLEVGVLGRWDATNVADADVAVITNIGIDHVDAEENHVAVGGRLLRLRTPSSIREDVFVPLHGSHQGDNAALALAAAEA